MKRKKKGDTNFICSCIKLKEKENLYNDNSIRLTNK